MLSLVWCHTDAQSKRWDGKFARCGTTMRYAKCVGRRDETVLLIRSPRAVIFPLSRAQTLGVVSTQFALGPNSRRVKATFRAFAIYRPKDVLEHLGRANHGVCEGLRLPRSVFCRCRYWTTALFGCYEAANPRHGYTPTVKSPESRSTSRSLIYAKERPSLPFLKG